MMKISSLIALLLTPVTAYADASYFAVYCNALGTYCGDGQAFIVHLAVAAVNVVVIPFVGGLAVIGVLWAAVKWQSSFGNDQGKEEAKKILQIVLVGMVLAVTGVAFVNWVCNLIESTTGGSGLCG
ncbi:hypothetical protein FJZ28_01570 [Candidatus Peregrinibacteria bacterium]|nr:hypothetical protein [Candidatus Peregrinibacteria bacterium]